MSDALRTPRCPETGALCDMACGAYCVRCCRTATVMPAAEPAVAWAVPDDPALGGAPTIPAELRPPPEHADKPLHWIGCAVGAPLIARWRNYGGSAYPACWEILNRSGHPRVSPAQLAAEGHHYLGPAVWDEWAQRISGRMARGAGAYHALSEAHARVAELETECRRLIAAERNTYETFASRLRLSAAWEHLPDVTTAPERDHSALFRAIGSRGP